MSFEVVSPTKHLTAPILERLQQLFHFITILQGWQKCQPFFFIMIKYTRQSRMPTATTSKTTTKAPAKRRTRKTATKPTVSKVTVTTFKGGKKVARVTTLKRPSTARLISADRYVKDIQTRWAIHNYEIQELFKGFPGYFNFVKAQYAKLNLS